LYDTVYNLGISTVHSYSIEGLICKNCYTLPAVKDSYGGILYTDQQQAQLFKRRCGSGVDISNIRPKGLPTKNAARTTDGIGVFMQRFSNTCEEVAQNGRRGACLLSISVHHPEVETFIKIKQDKTKVTGANVSLRITDEFMKAVETDSEYELRWPVDSKAPTISKRVKAKEIWNLIIDCAWTSGDPGLMFWDTALRESLPDLYKYINPNFADTSANPCGEIIQGFDSCRLITMNTYSYVNNPFTDDAEFDLSLYGEHTIIAQRLMDDLVDLELEAIDRILKKINDDPEPKEIKQIEIDLWEQLKKNCTAGRRTGLGNTAIADTIAAMNLPYASNEAIQLTSEIYKQLAISSMKSSCLMAKELGTFSLYNAEIEKDNLMLKRLFAEDTELEELHKKHGRRNISLTTTSPAGSVSLLTQTSSGIEPVFYLSYKRNKKVHDASKDFSFTDDKKQKWKTYEITHPKLDVWKKATGETDITKSPYHGSTITDIDYNKSVELQAAAQKWVTHSISKTHNLPEKTNKLVIAELYKLAWTSGCKGVTVFRNGCKKGVLEANDTAEVKLPKTQAPKRPKTLPCELHCINSKKAKILVVVGLAEGEPYELFASVLDKCEYSGEAGKITKLKRGHYVIKTKDGEVVIKDTHKSLTSEEAAITRLTSTALRHGADVAYIVQQLEKVEGEWGSFTHAIARVLKGYIKNGVKVTGDSCPNCKSTELTRLEGCVSCTCGWTKC
jgi:ribonucleoside-diphosphate reductase alpha chain